MFHITVYPLEGNGGFKGHRETNLIMCHQGCSHISWKSEMLYRHPHISMVRISMCSAAKPCSIYRIGLMIYQRSLLITETNNLPPFLDRHDSMPSWILEAFCIYSFWCFYFFKSRTWVFLSFMSSEALCPEKLELVDGWSLWVLK